MSSTDTETGLSDKLTEIGKAVAEWDNGHGYISYSDALNRITAILGLDSVEDELLRLRAERAEWAESQRCLEITVSDFDGRLREVERERDALRRGVTRARELRDEWKACAPEQTRDAARAYAADEILKGFER